MNKYQQSLDRIDQYRVNKNLKIDIKDILTLQELVDKYQEIQNVYFKKEPMESADLNGEKLQELYNFINKLLDKDTPKKTKTKMNKYNHIDRHCPICDSFVYSFDIYCGKCGQRIRSEE